MKKPKSKGPSKKASDRELMELAIAMSRSSPPEPGKIVPKVGAIIALRGVLLGEAFRGELSPGEHAEYTLLERKLPDQTLAGATLFTTLEPCTSRGDQKIPCADRIIDRRIKKVFIGMLDPNDEIRGLGELRLRSAGIEIGRFSPRLMAAVEELNRDFSRDQTSRSLRLRSKTQTSDPVEPGSVGPNGYPIGYTPEGDKVEWVPDEENPGQELPLLLRRNDREILNTYNEFWDKVWWNRHQVWLGEIERGDTDLSDEQEKVFRQAQRAAKKIERKYGKKNLGWNDFEWGLLSGRMSALAWVLGAEWDESLDT